MISELFFAAVVVVDICRKFDLSAVISQPNVSRDTCEGRSESP